MPIALFVGFLTQLSFAAAPPDGFVLTQWGRWTQAEAVESLDKAARVGARHISVIVQICQSDKGAHDLKWCEGNESETESFVDTYQGKRLEKLLPELATRRMTFSILPMMLSPDTNRQWISPTNRTEWFTRYGDKMVELARFSESRGSRDFVIASELTELFVLDAPWRQVIQRVREVFTGHLTISPVFFQYQLIRFWDALDSIGLSSYFPLTVSQRIDSVPVLTATWRAHRVQLLAFAALHRKPLTFVEVGYPTTNVAAVMPWDYEWDKRTLDPELQRRCFEAFARVWAGEKRLRAFQIWGLSSQPFELEKAFMPIDKPAEEPVRQVLTKRAAL